MKYNIVYLPFELPKMQYKAVNVAVISIRKGSNHDLYTQRNAVIKHPGKSDEVKKSYSSNTSL